MGWELLFSLPASTELIGGKSMNNVIFDKRLQQGGCRLISPGREWQQAEILKDFFSQQTDFDL